MPRQPSVRLGVQGHRREVARAEAKINEEVNRPGIRGSSIAWKGRWSHARSLVTEEIAGASRGSANSNPTLSSGERYASHNTSRSGVSWLREMLASTSPCRIAYSVAAARVETPSLL